ncbi:MAG: hypothetical protein ABI639_12460 [Thermoanaerobaculia bacterium]
MKRSASQRLFVVGSLVSAVTLIVAASPAQAQPEGSLSALLDFRLVDSNARNGWLDEGLDKLRFVDGERLKLGAGLLEARARFTPTLSGQVTVGAFDGLGEAIHATEAFLQYSPVPRSAWRMQARAGVFYPPISLENTGPGWSSPYTLSFSAIDSWIGEEVRTLGAEIELTDMGRFRSSPHDFSFTAALFRFNDPAGAILS